MYLFCYQQKVSNHIYTSHNSNAVILLYSENLANNGKNQNSHLHTFIVVPEVLNHTNLYILMNLILFFPFQFSVNKLEKTLFPRLFLTKLAKKRESEQEKSKKQHQYFSVLHSSASSDTWNQEKETDKIKGQGEEVKSKSEAQVEIQVCLSFSFIIYGTYFYACRKNYVITHSRVVLFMEKLKSYILLLQAESRERRSS